MRYFTLLCLCLSLVMFGCGSSQNTEVAENVDNGHSSENLHTTVNEPKTQENTTKPAENNNTTAANVSVPAQGGLAKDAIVVVYHTNELVEANEKKNFLEASKKKWIKDRNAVVITREEFHENMNKYEGHQVVTVEIQRNYGEFYMNVRAGEVKKMDGEAVEYPIGTKWERRAQTMDELVKEIGYADDVFQAKK